MIFFRVLWLISGWLGFYYFMWLCRGIDQGRAVGGVIACLMFGALLSYIVRLPEELKKRQWFSAFCSVYMSILFGWLWWLTLKGVNDSLVSGLPTTLASKNYVGLFGIEGFAGIAVFIPIYLAFVAVLWMLMNLWEKFYMPFKRRQTMRRGIEDEIKREKLRAAGNSFYDDWYNGPNRMR